MSAGHQEWRGSVPTGIRKGTDGSERGAAHMLIGREDLLARLSDLVRDGHHVLLWGPRGIGKSALIAALHPRSARVIDPLEHMHSHAAAQVLRAMDRGAQFVAASRSLDRAQLGAVRRFAWRFTTVRVPVLARLAMRRVVVRECGLAHIPVGLATDQWVRATVRIAKGSPGAAIALVRAAADRCTSTGHLPAPAAAQIEARIRQEGFTGRQCSSAHREHHVSRQ